MDTVNIQFQASKKGIYTEIEVPLNLTANDFVIALNEAYGLEINTADPKECYFQAERPIALLRGNKTLEEFGVRNGTLIHFTK